MLTTRIIDDLHEAEALSERWRELLKRAAHDEPVSTPSWLLAWWRQFGDADGRKLALVVVEEGEKLVGLAPLATRLMMRKETRAAER